MPDYRIPDYYLDCKEGGQWKREGLDKAMLNVKSLKNDMLSAST